MRRNELDRLFHAMLESHSSISDLIFAVDRPFQVESLGELKPVNIEPHIDCLTPFHTEQIALAMIGHDRRLIKELIMMGACDCSYALTEKMRFRVNIFKQRGHFSIVMRKPQVETPTAAALGLPPIFQEMSRLKNGLILVTGATGSGKTTTLGAMLNDINETQAVHVVTLEDPIEFMHVNKKATFSQRELGQDFDSFPGGLRSALRQAPKVILIGEMRDRHTVEIALSAAETGHLVLSTIHTVDAGQAMNRILGMFDRAEEKQIRLRLADSIRYVVSQRLVPKLGGERLLLQEIMGTNLRVREAIALGETEQRNFYDIIDTSSPFGWTTFDQSVVRAFEADLVTEETAQLYATRKGKVSHEIDLIKKQRGLFKHQGSGLRLDVDPLMRNRPVPAGKV